MPDKTYGDILKGHFAEKFRFHRRNQEEGESVIMFAASLKKLSEY
jgi:hypothetical protein